MKKYILSTTATIKPNDSGKWWIDGGLIRDIRLEANSVIDALRRYSEITDEKYGVTVSNSAITRRQPMYIDRKDGSSHQTGYVITGKTSFDNDRRGWVDRYIDLWIDIKEYTVPEFPEATR